MLNIKDQSLILTYNETCQLSCLQKSFAHRKEDKKTKKKGYDPELSRHNLQDDRSKVIRKSKRVD